MQFFSLIASGIESVLTFPYRIIAVAGRARGFRVMTKKSTDLAGGELKSLSGGAAFVRGLGKILLYLLFLAVIVGAFVGLWYLNRWLDLERQLGGPAPWLRAYWLPLLLALLVVALLVGRAAVGMLGPAAEPTDFADIHAAWTEARAAVAAADISLQDVPLFLVVGRPAAGVGALFAASRLPFPVNGVPAAGDSPIQVYANAAGVFVACPGASLLGTLAQRFVQGEDAKLHLTAARTVFDDPDPTAAVAPEEDTSAPLLLPDDDPPPARRPATPARRHTPQVLNDATEVNRTAARLRYLGRLLAFHREPYCGANGIVLVVPSAALAGQAEADQAAGAAAADLAAARDGLGTDCPVTLLAADLETLPGATEFVRLIPDDRKDRLLGLPFPATNDLPADRLTTAVTEAVTWTGGAVERMLIRGITVGERSGPAELTENIARYQFLAATRAALPRLADVAKRVAGPGVRYAGGFLVATGSTAGGQAFTAGVFRLLADHQNAVTWTPSARAADAGYKAWATFGYLTVGAFLVGVGYLSYLHWLAP